MVVTLSTLLIIFVFLIVFDMQGLAALIMAVILISIHTNLKVFNINEVYIPVEYNKH